MAPVFLLAVLPVVAIEAVLVDLFLAVLVPRLAEVVRYIVVARVLFSPLAKLALFDLNAVFLSCCKV